MRPTIATLGTMPDRANQQAPDRASGARRHAARRVPGGRARRRRPHGRLPRDGRGRGRSSRPSNRARCARCSRRRAPEDPEPLEAILDDYRRLIEPNATHWQHPGFLAYFATTASGPGILGEMLTATLGQNAMLWRTSPIGTELEEVVVGWLRQALGLPAAFDGLLTDTASTSSLIALAGARQAAGIDAAALGLTGRPDVARAPGLRLDGGPQLDREGVHDPRASAATALARVAVDDDYQMRPDALAATIAADRAAGHRPIAIVATVGTTSSTSVDPVAAIADIAEREGLWLHVDAAYAGVVALLPERRAPFAGWERADSIVVNPHKWLFTPLDASLLLTPADGRATGGVQPRARVPADARPGHAGPRLQRVHAAARPAVPGAQAVDPAPLVRAGGAASPDRAAPRADRAVRGAGRRGPGLGAPGAASRSRRSVSAGTRPAGAAPTTPSTRPTPRSWMPSTGRARSSCRIPASTAGSRSASRSATCAPRRATSSVRGTCCAPRRPSARRRRREARSSGRQVLREGGGAARLVRRQSRDGGGPLARLLPEGDAARPTISWSDAVDEALCVGWIDGIRKRLDDTRSAQRFTPRRKGSNWSAINVDKVAALTAAGPDATRRAARPSRREPRRRRASTRTNRPRRSFSDDELARFRADPAAWADWERRPPSYRKNVTYLGDEREAGAETRERRLEALIADSAAGVTVAPDDLGPGEDVTAEAGAALDEAIAALRALDLGDDFDPRAAEAIVAVRAPSAGRAGRRRAGSAARLAEAAEVLMRDRRPSTGRPRSGSRCRSTSSERRSQMPELARRHCASGSFRAIVDDGALVNNAATEEGGGSPSRGAIPGTDRRGRCRRQLAAHRREDLDHLAAEPAPTPSSPPGSADAERPSGRAVLVDLRVARRRAIGRVRGARACAARRPAGSCSTTSACRPTPWSLERRVDEPDARGPAPGAWFGIAIAATYLGIGEGARATSRAGRWTAARATVRRRSPTCRASRSGSVGSTPTLRAARIVLLDVARRWDEAVAAADAAGMAAVASDVPLAKLVANRPPSPRRTRRSASRAARASWRVAGARLP